MKRFSVMVVAAAVMLLAAVEGSAAPDKAPKYFTTPQIIRGFRSETAKLLIRINTNVVHTSHQGDVLFLPGNRYAGYSVVVFNRGWTLNTTGYYTHRPVKPDAAGIYWRAFPNNSWMIDKKFGQNVWLQLDWTPSTPAEATGPRVKPILPQDWDWFDSVLIDVTTR